jgi:hypothetical protein
MKRYQFIVCKVLQREAYLCAARSPHIVDVTIMPQGLHNEPERLGSELSKALHVTHDLNGNEYDGVLMGYGLCSNGTLGITAKITTVIPRAHDCITLMLGSKEQYQDYFSSHRGVYWYSAGWIDQTQQPSKERYENAYEIYKEKYGEDNAEYLMEMEQNWIKEYSRATYIDWGLPESERYRQFTKECAEYLGWEYDELSGDQTLMQRMADGDWNDDALLILKPGQSLQADVTNPGIIRAE